MNAPACLTPRSVTGHDLCPRGAPCRGGVVSSTAYPLTCDWCKHEPAKFLLVWDRVVRGTVKRYQALVGDHCANRDICRAREIAVTPTSAWLFRLVPDMEGVLR
jgi:hypothetical protein